MREAFIGSFDLPVQYLRSTSLCIVRGTHPLLPAAADDEALHCLTAYGIPPEHPAFSTTPRLPCRASRCLVP